jgi:hypothetical protein
MLVAATSAGVVLTILIIVAVFLILGVMLFDGDWDWFD